MKKGKLLKLFCSMGKIGCVGFGGGNALVPILQKNIVEEAQLVEQNEFDEDVVVANITPGALPVEIAGGIGKRVAGWKGMLAGAMGMAFPGVLFTVFLLSIMSYLNQEVLRQIEFLTVGITAFIACLLTNYIAGALKKPQDCIVVFIVFGLTCGKHLFRLLGIGATPVFGLATVHIFILAFFVIFCVQCKKWLARIACEKSKKTCEHEQRISSLKIKETAKELLVLLILLVFSFVVTGFITKQAYLYLGNGFISSIMSFGGGDAYLTVAEGMFVNTELVTEDTFYGSIVPLVNILPGSILCKTFSAVGFYVGYTATENVALAYVVALAGFICSIVASCGVFVLVGCIYQGFGQMEMFRLIKRWTRPIVSGLMLTVILALLYQNRKMGIAENIGWVPVVGMLGIYGLDMFLYYKQKLGNGKIIMISILLSFALCNVCVM